MSQPALYYHDWRKSDIDPPVEGRYLIMYKQGRTRKAFTADWEYLDHVKRYGWANSLPDVEITHWAGPIDPPREQ